MVEIRLASFNVCGLPSRLLPVAERAAHFCRLIQESDVDVVTFQEVWSRHALGVLRTHLPKFPCVAWQRGLAGQPAGGLATFSRHPLSAVRYTSFRGARPAAGGLGFRARTALNSALQGVLTVEVRGIVVANTHLTANRDGDWEAANRHHAFQRTQLRMLHTVVREATVVAGDFNIASDSPLYEHIVDGAWHDPFAATDPATFHVEFLPPGRLGRRIDYLLVRDAAVLDRGLLFDAPLTLPGGRQVYLSDHVALTARIACGEGVVSAG